MDQYNKIAELIMKDLRSRSGCDLDIDDEIMEEIIDTWSKIIQDNLESCRK